MSDGRWAGAALALAVAAAGLTTGAAPARAAALFGGQKETVLWVPAESFTDWAALDSALGRAPEVKLTIALSPSMLTPAAKRVMANWMFAGRVEGALRVDGDPILPLIAGGNVPRPDDVPTRVDEARQRWKTAFGSAPAGFAPGAGALTPDVIESLRALGVTWAASGDYSGSTVAWAASGALTLVPLRAPSTAGRELAPADLGLDTGDGGLYVVDEADGLVPPGSLLRLLEGTAAERASAGWATVSESLQARAGSARPAAQVADWPAWTGGLEPWTASAASKHAWSLYDLAASAIDRYQNSGTAQLGRLDRASRELHLAQANRYFRDIPSAEGEAAARSFREHLLAVYRTLDQTPPDALFSEAPAAGSQQDQPTAVRVSQGPDWAEFDNPPGSFGRAPPGFQLEGAAPGDAFRVDSLRVQTGDAGLSLTFTLGRLDSSAQLEPPPQAAPDMGRVMVEAYMDLNHVMRAGSTRLLFDADTFVMAHDAWEFALTVSAWGAYLYKASPYGSPRKVARLGVLADPSTREIRVVIPNSLLRGNALRWGYVVTTSAADPATAERPPVKPLRSDDVTSVLGLLGPLERQKELAAAKPGTHPRLHAVRAD